MALRLNNVPRYLRGALNQSYYPDGVYTAGDVETLKNDISGQKIRIQFPPHPHQDRRPFAALLGGLPWE